MIKKAKTQPTVTSSSKKCMFSERRHNDRRLCQKKGYTYIPMVGWMCRRENVRRKGDNVCEWQSLKIKM